MEEEARGICPYASACGGCSLREMPYANQLERKTERIRSLLKPFTEAVSPCVPGPQMECRNKVHLVFGREKGRVAVGFFSAETHRMVRVDACPMHGAWFSSLAAALEDWANRMHIPPYVPQTGRGLLRFAVARKLGDGLMLSIVSQNRKVPGLQALYARLKELFPRVSLWLNENDRRDSAVFSRRFFHIAGERKLFGTLLGVAFSLSPDAFFQVNEQMAARLYQRILTLAQQSGAQTVVDAYSGIGITSLLFARAGMRVISVEQTPSAVADAKEMARKNGLSGQIQALCGDCAKVLPRLRPEGETFFFVDPPRRGLGESVCRTIAEFAPRHVLYLSCGPDALAEDVRRLTAAGYRVQLAEPFDLFPHTEHVETVVLLSKGEIDSKRIRVEFPLDDMEITAFREKATYPQIKEYVLEQTGLKVSSLYISQIKRKCGLDVGDSYNKPKSEDARVPLCPPEKETAIMDALRHFGMIS